MLDPFYTFFFFSMHKGLQLQYILLHNIIHSYVIRNKNNSTLNLTSNIKGWIRRNLYSVMGMLPKSCLHRYMSAKFTYMT